MSRSPKPSARARMIEVAEQAGYRRFVEALRTAGYTDLLDGAGPFTAFAPSDAAFAKLTAEKRDALAGDATLLAQVIGYHFAPRKVAAARIVGRRVRIVMHAGGEVILDGRAGFRINAAQVEKRDLEAANGVIHGIDAVIWPSAPALAVSP